MDNRRREELRHHVRIFTTMPRFLIGMLVALFVGWLYMAVDVLGWWVLTIPMGLFMIYVAGHGVQQLLQRLETWLGRDQE